VKNLSWRVGLCTLLSCMALMATTADAATKFHRLAWDQDPARNVVIGFSPDGSSSNPSVRFGYSTQESNWDTAQVSSTERFDGLTSHFVRLSGLRADSAVYYRVCDQDGCGDRFWFQTAPQDNSPYVVVAGGDTRTGWTNRRQGNQLVAKIRPLFVMHGGDFTNSNNNSEMQTWLTDWALTYSRDQINGIAYRRIYPIIPTHGNHEDNNYSTLCEVFGVDFNQDGRCSPSDTYGAFDISPLLRVYTLNSQFKDSGWSSYASAMNNWLQRDLANNGGNAVWRFAQYHKPIFPHSNSKSDNQILFDWWAREFYDHAMNLVVESDTHINKLTRALVPSGSDFSATTSGGTVYVGEGSWGAPARSANDPKSWTIDLASIQQFKVIQVTADQLAVRTAQFDSRANTLSRTERAADPLALPSNVDWWSAAEVGEQLTLVQNGSARSVISNGGNGGGDNDASISLAATDDTFVSSTRSGSSFNGASDGLLADGSDSTYGETMSLIRFDLSDLSECAISSASLEINVTNASGGNYAIYTASAGWQENSATWNSVGGSAIQGAFVTVFSPSSSGTMRVDLSQSAIVSDWRANGNTGLVIASNGTSDGLDISSKETGVAPVLRVAYDSSADCGDGSTGGADGGTGGDTGGSGSGGDTPTSTNSLESGRLSSNEYLRSANGDYRFYLQGDGNLVLRDWNTRDSLWSSGTSRDGGSRLVVQSDGNLVLYTESGNPVWSSDTNGTDASRLVLNNDGSLALYSDSGAVVWSVNGNGQTGGSGSDAGDDTGSDSGGDTGGSSNGTVTHVNSIADYDGDGDVVIDVPSNTREGDLMMLFLSRTDDVLPIRWNGWTAGASCYKTTNGQNECHVIRDCVDQQGDYCRQFDGGNGHDLATVVFYRTASANEPSNYRFNMNGDKAGWAILSTVRGADNGNPIRDVNQESDDGNADSLFPSVYGEAGDMLMLSQAFDDTTDRDDFRAPDNMELFRWIAGSDEAGYVFGATLSSNGETGSRKTRGPGGPGAKDALISLTVRAGEATSDGDTGGDGGTDGGADDDSGSDTGTGSDGGDSGDTGTGPGDGWAYCADENGVCAFSGAREVAYGAEGVFAQQVFTGGVNCSNGVFGDPIPGVRKSCWYQNSTTGGDTGGDTGGTTEVDEVSRADGTLVGGAGASQPGYALYVFDNDQGATGSTCAGDCADMWPPLLVADSGASGVSSLGTITRPDGSLQATYNGQPLYFFAQDGMPGETSGDGANNVWWLAEGSSRDSGDDTGGDNGGDSAGSGGDTPTSINSLRNGSMNQGERLSSSNGAFRLTLQGDGNLVLRNSSGDALWSSGTSGDSATRLSMQSDGNLVLYTSNGTPVWASDTNSTGADRLVLNNDGSLALYANGNPVWAVNGDGMTGDGGGDSGSGGDVGDSAAGQTVFSSPGAALYSLNDSAQRVFPQYINTNFNGNGHTQSWDGRIIVVTRSQGWFAAPMRPERITRNGDGSPNFRDGFFGNTMLLEANDDAPDMQHNWIAMVPDNAVTTENPYPSDANGNYRLNGTYATYKAIMYHTSKRNGDNDQVGIQRAEFIIRDANTPNAQLVSSDFTSDFQRLSRRNGQDVRCIEMTVTIDGRLLVCQGHPDNNGRIDNLVYSWNPTPNSLTGWTVPRSLADMYYVDRNSDVAGVPFRVRFPIAEFPIRDATGTAYRQGDLIKGAYPWISRDGSEVFYQASREGVSARRTATSVIGRWTGGAIRHIDGPINRDRSATSKLFLSSPGAFTTMWEPYKDVEDLKIPYSVRGPSYPIIGSNTRDYSEVDFDDYLDGNYVMALGMNEQIDRAGGYQTNRTPDTSGNFNNATLQGGAAFPQEFNGNDRLEGRFGQGIYFPAGSYLSVAKSAGWASLQGGVTVDFFVRRINNGGGDVRLFDLSNGLRIYLNNGSTLTAVMQDESGDSQTLSGGNVGSAWTHVAFRFDPATGEMALFMNGQQTAARTVNGFGSLRVSGQLRIGPVNSNALVMLDEVHVSNVAREDYEIGHNAYADTHQEPGAALANTIPEHLSSLRDQAFGVDQFSFAAAELGESLFNDEILSRERTTSCAACHDPARTFTDGLAIAQGNEPTDEGERNTPMLQNRLFSSFQGWGGLSATLDSQALDPIQAAHEMNLPVEQALQRLRTEGNYATRFEQAFGEQPNAQNLPRALASFQAIQFSARTRVDEYLDGNKGVLSASERRGLNLFRGEARCSGCHSGDNYTDESFRNNGLAQNGDVGRARQTARDRDDRLFKVPSLRSVAHTAPYMHDGSIATLRGVVERYNEGAEGVAGVDTDIRPLELSNQQLDDLVAFMNALSGDGATDSGSGTDPDGGTGGDSGGDTGGDAGGDSSDTGNDDASDPATADNTLGLDRLNANEFLTSANGDYRLFMQGDGNLVLRDWRTMESLWSTGTNGSGADRLSMQSDGNLVLYNAGGDPVWATSAGGTAANRLTLNNNGSVGLYGDSGLVLTLYDDGVSFSGTLPDDGGTASGDDSGSGDSGGDDIGGDDNGGSNDNDIGGAGWTLCADENGFCDFSGTRVVAYGAEEQFAQQTFTDGVQCSNSVFGDPTPGVRKSCWYQGDSTDSTDPAPEPVNVASGKIASQSSTGWGGDPARALDGNSSGQWGDGSVTHTNAEASPWWQVDLGSAHDLERVTLWNRTDCCSNRLSNFHVDYLDQSGQVIATQDYPGTAGQTTEIELSASGVHAVRVRLYSGNVLSLAEVELWGNPVNGTVTPTTGSTGTLATPGAAPVIADQVTVSQPNSATWHAVAFDQAFGRVPTVVMGPPSYNGAQPTAVRVRNVTRSGFEFKIDEWDYLDGGHITETLAYLAVTPGVHDWNGMRVEAGQVDGVADGWSSVNYSGAFAGAPVVLSQQVSDNGAQTTTTRLRNSTASGFQLRVQAEEANGSSPQEQVHYIAISAGDSSLAESGAPVSAGFTGNFVTHDWHGQNFGRNFSAPLVFADMQTFDGPDPAALRYTNVSASSVDLKVEEEQSRDEEVRHTTENVGWVVFGQ